VLIVSVIIGLILKKRMEAEKSLGGTVPDGFGVDGLGGSNDRR
jgi:hypothetical protein